MSVFGLVCNNLARRSTEARQATAVRSTAQALLMLQDSPYLDEFDQNGMEDEVDQVETDLHRALAGHDDYGGIHSYGSPYYEPSSLVSPRATSGWTL